MQVRDLAGALVPGYRAMNVLGVRPGRRGVLYHRLFSSTATDFVSEPAKVQQALQTVSQAVTGLKSRLTVSWVPDRGFDDVAVWRTVWEQQEWLVWRVQHPERLVEYQVAARGGAATSARPQSASGWSVLPKRRWSSNAAAKRMRKNKWSPPSCGPSGAPDL